MRPHQHSSSAALRAASSHLNKHLCVFVREESINQRWKDMLQQLQEQRGLLGNVVEHLSVLRDIKLVSQELKDLQVS